MYGNDGQKKDTPGGKDSRFHDIIHNVNNDGLEDMAWPGSLARHTDNRTIGKGDVQAAKTTQTQTQTRTTTQAQEMPPVSSPKSKNESLSEKTDKSGKKSQRPQQEKKQEHVVRQNVVIKDEWTDFLNCLENYDSHKENVKRYGIYLPERVYNSYQTVFNRDMSAAMSVELLKFIDRNKDNMIALISQKSDLL